MYVFVLLLRLWGVSAYVFVDMLLVVFVFLLIYFCPSVFFVVVFVLSLSLPLSLSIGCFFSPSLSLSQVMGVCVCCLLCSWVTFLAWSAPTHESPLTHNFCPLSPSSSKTKAGSDEQQHFYANRATEMRHFCLKRDKNEIHTCKTKRRWVPKSPRNGQHPERDQNEVGQRYKFA